MVFALTVDDGERESDLDEVMRGLGIVGWAKAHLRRAHQFIRSCFGGHAEFIIGRAFARPGGFAHEVRRPHQILPVTSFCIRLAFSTSRRQACSRNDIMRSMSRSLGSGISILRSPSATFGSGFFSESVFGNASLGKASLGKASLGKASSILPGPTGS